MPRKLGIEKLVFKPFENESKLECLFRIVTPEEEIGGFLLRDGDRYCLRFGFRFAGIHPLMSPEQVQAVLRRLEEGLRGLPQGESLRIHFRSFANDSARQQELEELAQATTIPELQFLLFSEQRATRELTEHGLRQPKDIVLFVTYIAVACKLAVAIDIRSSCSIFKNCFHCIPE